MASQSSRSRFQRRDWSLAQRQRGCRLCVNQWTRKQGANGLIPSLLCPSWVDCIIATRGYDFRKGQLVWINVTQNPTAEWIARQITEAFPWNESPRYLIRDRDRIYGEVALRRIRAMGIRDKPIAPASPWQNSFTERLIGSIRRECLDHLVILGEAHLRRILRNYASYYNKIRTHRSLDKDAPAFRSVQRVGTIMSYTILGGLHHHYVRV
jgi:Integrase core domain